MLVEAHARAGVVGKLEVGEPLTDFGTRGMTVRKSSAARMADRRRSLPAKLVEFGRHDLAI